MFHHFFEHGMDHFGIILGSLTTGGGICDGGQQQHQHQVSRGSHFVEIWSPRGTCGGAHGEGRIENLRTSVKIKENLEKTSKIVENLRKSVKIYENRCENYGFERNKIQQNFAKKSRKNH